MESIAHRIRVRRGQARERAKMQRYEYLQHLVFQRSLDLREKGPRFDAAGGGGKKKR